MRKASKPPISRSDARALYTPFLPQIVRGHQMGAEALQRVHGGLAAVGPIAIAGVRHDLVVDGVQKAIRDAKNAPDHFWVEDHQVGELVLGDRLVLRFNKVDDDCRPCRNKTKASAMAHEQGLLYASIYGDAEPADEERPLIVVGSQWDSDVAHTLLGIRITCMYAGSPCWVDPINVETAPLPIVTLKPAAPKPPAQIARKGKPEIKRKKSSDASQ